MSTAILRSSRKYPRQTKAAGSGRGGSHLPTKRDDESERRRENHAGFKQVFTAAIGTYFSGTGVFVVPGSGTKVGLMKSCFSETNVCFSAP